MRERELLDEALRALESASQQLDRDCRARHVAECLNAASMIRAYFNEHQPALRYGYADLVPVANACRVDPDWRL